jgi:hypothetical protein
MSRQDAAPTKKSTSSEGRTYSGKKPILYAGAAFQPLLLSTDFSRLESRSRQRQKKAQPPWKRAG